MTLDVHQMRQRFFVMLGLNGVLMLAAVGLLVGHFAYGVGWMLWGFLALVAAAFGVQLWFIRGVGRMGKGE